VCDEVVTLCCRHHHVASGCVGVVVKLFSGDDDVLVWLWLWVWAWVWIVVVVHAELCCTTSSMLAGVGCGLCVSCVINFRLETVIITS